jgi:ribosome-binding protein aMBF1 (putative translation factor)
MKSKKSNIKTWAEFKDEQFGKRGTPGREKLEAGYETFKLGAMIQEARHEQGMTREELAAKCGTTKSYISKVENDVKEVRISTLKKIVHDGLHGELQLSIKLLQHA